MSVDKLVDSTQLDADLTSVANAIRTKGGTSAQLAFPADFVTAINAISGGGGDSGTVTASSGKLILPVPRGYYFVALLSTARTLEYGDLPEIMHISSAGVERWWSRKVPNVGTGSISIVSSSATPPWWISVTDTTVTVNASNNNTSGSIKAGDEYFYLAWRDA